MVRATIERLERSTFAWLVKIGAFLAYIAFATTVVLPAWLEHGESRFFPVITPMVVESITPTPRGTVVVGWTERLRDCDFAGVDWYLGQRSGTSSKLEQVTFPEGQKTRQSGEIIVATLLVSAQPRDVLTNSFANARYQCHWWQPEHMDVIQPLFEGTGTNARLLADYLGPRVEELETQVERLRAD